MSEEKTLITNICSKPIKFLGVEIKMANKNGKWVNRVSPEKERFQRKMKDLSREIFYVRKTSHWIWIGLSKISQG